jgi:hypothetical protein
LPRQRRRTISLNTHWQMALVCAWRCGVQADLPLQASAYRPLGLIGAFSPRRMQWLMLQS